MPRYTAISWHLRKQVGVIAYPMYSASVASLRVRRINIEIKKKKFTVGSEGCVYNK